MRITPLLIVEGVLTLLLLIFCTYTWFSGSYQRRVGGTWRKARKALTDDDPNRARDILESFLELRPDEVAVRLMLADLYARKGELTQAAAHYNKVASGSGAEKRLRALAEVQLGMIDGLAGIKALKGKDKKKSSAKFASAKAHFEEAIKLEHPEGLESEPAGSGKAGEKKVETAPGEPTLAAFGDACAGLGLLALYAGDREEAERRFKQALSGKSLLGKEVPPEVYNGMGLVLGAKSQMKAAHDRFKMTKRYRPKWKDPDRNWQLLQRDKVGEEKMDEKLRKSLLSQILKTIAKNKKPPANTLNLLGCGYFRLGDIGNALKYLGWAVKRDPNTSLYQVNLLAARWKVLESARAKYLKMKDDLYPQPTGDPLERFWKAPVGRKKTTRKLSPVQKAVYKKTRDGFWKAEAAFDSSARAVLLSVEDLPPELERDLILLRIDYLRRTGPRLSRSKKKEDREKGKKMLAEAEKLLAEALKKYPKAPRLARLKGVDLLKAKDLKGALAAFEVSLAAQPDQADLKEIQATFAPKVEVVGFRPVGAPGRSGAVLARSSQPLLGALFRVYTGPVPLSVEKVRLELDGRPAVGSFWGSEYLHVPTGKLADGEHALHAEVEDPLGRKASGDFKFLVDGSPPEITATEPRDLGKVRSSRPKLVVHYHDLYSGVDPSSVEVELRNDKGATTFVVEHPVQGGRYTYTYEKYGIKKGDPVGDGKAVFSPTRDLGTGTYRLTISVGDVRGLKTVKEWRFTIER